MSEAVTNRTQILYSPETVFNEVPATPAMTALPFTGESLKHSKATDNSKAIRADRNVQSLVEIGRSAAGDINFELQHANYDALLYAAFMDAARTETDTGISCNLVAAGATVTRVTGNWTALFRGARYVKITGATNPLSNGVKRIVSNTATVLTLAPGSVAADESAVSLTLLVNYVRNGTTQKSFLLEKQFVDIGDFIAYRGMTVNQLSISCAAKQRVTGALAFMGSKGVEAAATVSGSVAAYDTTRPIIRSGVNVGGVYSDSVTPGTMVLLTTGLRKLDFTINNNLRGRDVIQQIETKSMGLGEADVKGTIEAYFEDRTLLKNFYTHQATQLHQEFRDDQGNVLALHFPVIQYTDGDPQIPGNNQDINLALPFTATLGSGLDLAVAPTAVYTVQMDLVRLVP